MSQFDPPSGPQEAILQHLRMFASRGLPYIPDLATVQWLKSLRLPAQQLHYITFLDTNGQRWSYLFLLALTGRNTWHILHGIGGGHTDRHRATAPSTSSDRPWLHLGGGGTPLQPPATVPAYQQALLEAWKIVESLRATQGGQQEAQALLEALQERLATVPREERGKEAWKVLQAFEALPGDRRGKEAWKQLEALQKLPVEQPDPAEALWNALNPFYAYGEVVDHGFDIVQVRLISPNGVVLEDTVQDGLVLFFSDQPIFMPLQAELYNRAGHLVSSQTVLQSKLFSS
jgi:hypothetical protein